MIKSNKSKAYHYIWQPMSRILFDIPAVRFLREGKIKVKNAYLQDLADPESKINDPYLYVLVDTSYFLFAPYLKELKEVCKHLVDDYHVGDKYSETTMLKFRIPNHERIIPLFLDSKYSEMYTKDEIEMRDHYFRTDMNEEHSQIEEYFIITKDKRMYKKIIEEFNINPKSDTAKALLELEYDDKIRLDKEIVNTDELFEPVV